MIHLKQAVIVEGKYDKIRLKSFLDAEIITTDGFRIFKDREKVSMIRRIAEKRGIIILTDSDSAGFMIRGHLTGIIDPKYIINVFVPEIKGRERRKTQSSAEGLLGVEGLSEDIIVGAFKKAGVNIDGSDSDVPGEKLTHTDLYKLGLSGGENCREKRNRLISALKLPRGMSTNQLLTALNTLVGREELYKMYESEEQDEIR